MTNIPYSSGFGQPFPPQAVQWGVLVAILGISIITASYLIWKIPGFENQTIGAAVKAARRSSVSRITGRVRKDGLLQATLLTAALKLSIFSIGVLIIGALEPRTVLNACPSLSPPVSVYQFQPWPSIEAYTDYRDLYLPCLVSPFLKGANLYHLFGVTYNYPPLFLYILAAFASIANVIWLPALPLVLFDILTVVPVNLIARDFVFSGNEKLAFAVSLIWAANPINLFYGDLMWLNTAPTTFFLILAVYLFLKESWLASSLALAVSTGLKQVSLIFFPVLLIFLYRSKGVSKKFVIFSSTYILSLIIISTPYVFTETQYYFWSLGLPLLGIPASAPSVQPTFSTSLSEPVRITTFLGYVSTRAAKFVSESYLYLDYVLAAVMAVLLLIYLAVGSVQFRSSSAKSKNAAESNFSGEVLLFTLAILLIFLALYGGGIYKYYFVTVTPLATLLFTKKSAMIVLEATMVFLFLAPREITPWVAVFLLFFIFTSRDSLLRKRQAKFNLSDQRESLFRV